MVQKVLGVYKAEVPQTSMQTHIKRKKKKKEVDIPTKRGKDLKPVKPSQV